MSDSLGKQLADAMARALRAEALAVRLQQELREKDRLIGFALFNLSKNKYEAVKTLLNKALSVEPPAPINSTQHPDRLRSAPPDPLDHHPDYSYTRKEADATD